MVNADFSPGAKGKKARIVPLWWDEETLADLIAWKVAPVEIKDLVVVNWVDRFGFETRCGTPLCINFSRPTTEDVKAVWEERFQKTYGFWRGFIDTVVARYLDCGVEDNGFARLKCDACGSERLLTLSCKQRGICPSCDAKRAAALAAFLKDELLSNVGHRLWTFTLWTQI